MNHPAPNRRQARSRRTRSVRVTTARTARIEDSLHHLHLDPIAMRTSFATLKRTMFAPREEGTMSANDGRESSRWAGLAVLTLPGLLTSMDITILHSATPNITHALRPTASQTTGAL